MTAPGGTGAGNEPAGALPVTARPGIAATSGYAGATRPATDDAGAVPAAVPGIGIAGGGRPPAPGRAPAAPPRTDHSVAHHAVDHPHPAHAAGRAHTPFGVGAELRRQIGRRRTALTLGLLTLLPVVVALAFKYGGGEDDDDGNGNGAFSGLADLATGGALNFGVFVLFVSSTFLLVVTAALFCGDTIASEASWGSLRYLLAVPVPRGRLLAVKLFVALLSVGAAIVLLVASSLLVGTIAFGWDGLTLPVGGELGSGEGLLRLLGIAGAVALSLLPVAMLAFALSAGTEAPLAAVGGAVLLNVLAAILDAVTALGDLRNLLPGHYSNAWLGLLSSPQQTDDLLRGAISSLVYGALFGVWAWRRFLRRDVTS